MLALGSAAVSQAAAQTAGAPADGRAVLERMRSAYAGKWYPNLTFVQKTTVKKPDGTSTVTTWYESVHGGAHLRIDFGNPADGNGAIYTPDSLIAVRQGKVVRAVGYGNPFLPLIMGVYLQPVTETARQLALYSINLDRVSDGQWEGRRVYVVGAANAADSTSPQFWIDRERLVLVRMLVPFAPGRPVSEARLGGYVKVGGGWLATTVGILHDGQIQTEEYSEWTPRDTLAAALFDPAQWSTAPHWARPKS